MNGTAFLTSSSDSPYLVRYLDPKNLRFVMNGANVQLTVGDEISYLDVQVIRMFPLSEPERYLSVRSNDKQEIGLIPRLADLDAENRRVVLQELERRYLMPVVQRVIDVKERFGIAEWEVETNRGRRIFTMRNMHENIVQLPPARCLLSDVDGNRYDVPDLRQLDASSRAYLWRYF
jgi:hypothetical protein